MISIAAPLLMAGGLVNQGYLRDRVIEPNLYETHSAKPAADMEFCIARSLADMLAQPFGPFHDGPSRVIIYGTRLSEVKVQILVVMTKVGDGTKIEVKAKNPATMLGFKDALDACAK